MLTQLQSGVDELSDSSKQEIENRNKKLSELKNIITKMKNTLEGIDKGIRESGRKNQ